MRPLQEKKQPPGACKVCTQNFLELGIFYLLVIVSDIETLPYHALKYCNYFNNDRWLQAAPELHK